MMKRVSSTDTCRARAASAASLTERPASMRAGKAVTPRCSRSETATIRSSRGKRSLRRRGSGGGGGLPSPTAASTPALWSSPLSPAPAARLSGTSARTIAR